MKTTSRKRAIGRHRPTLRPALRYAALLMAAGAIAACSSEKGDVSPGNIEGNGMGILFKAEEIPGSASRATVTTTATIRKVGVFGYGYTGDFATNKATMLPDYFFNQAVADLPGNGTWTYSGVTKYWPTNGNNMSFFAYAPYIDVENTFTLYPAAKTDAGVPKITYTVPASMLDQIDLLYANWLDKKVTDTPSGGGQVPLSMNHAMTKIDFQVMLDDGRVDPVNSPTGEQGRPFIVKFDTLSFQNLVGGGTLDLSTGIWTPVRSDINPATTPLANYDLIPTGHGGMNTLLNNPGFDARNAPAAAGTVNPWAFNSLLKTGQYLMLRPQVLTDLSDGYPAQVEIKYCVTNVFSGQTTYFSKVIALAPALAEWTPGLSVTYQLIFTLIPKMEIELDVATFNAITAQPWDNMNSTNPITGQVR